MHTAPAHLVDLITPWVSLTCFAILTAAAFLHWGRTRHWCLLALATGSLLAVLAMFGMQITVTVLSGQWRDLDALGFATSVLRIWQWFMVAGVVIAAAGGIGAINWAMKLRQQLKSIDANAGRPQSGPPPDGFRS